MRCRKKIIMLFLVLLLQIFIPVTNSIYGIETTKQIRELKTGDVIYFDNSGTNWDIVKIYFYSKSGGSELTTWNSRPEMTNIPGTDIYKFEITSDLNIENYKDNHIIFSNDSGEQTIDLGFIESGYAFTVDSTNNEGKKEGYWYVYDKTELIELLKEAKKYEADAEYYTNKSFEELEKQIVNAENIVNGMVKVENDKDPSIFYTQSDISLEDLKNAINGLEINKEKLEELVNEEIDLEPYEDDSVNDYIGAIKKGEEVLIDDDATVEDVKSAVLAIEEAKANLIEKTVEETLENPNTSDNITVFLAIFILSATILAQKANIIKKYEK